METLQSKLNRNLRSYLYNADVQHATVDIKKKKNKLDTDCKAMGRYFPFIRLTQLNLRLKKG